MLTRKWGVLEAAAELRGLLAEVGEDRTHELTIQAYRMLKALTSLGQVAHFADLGEVDEIGLSKRIRVDDLREGARSHDRRAEPPGSHLAQRLRSIIVLRLCTVSQLAMASHPSSIRLRLMGAVVAVGHMALLSATCASTSATSSPAPELPTPIATADLWAEAMGTSKQPRSTNPADQSPSPDTKATEPASRTEIKPTVERQLSIAPQPTSYALVIGIESYRDLPPVTGARRDAQRFAELLRQTFGIPDDHVHLRLDARATRSDIASELEWLKSSVKEGGRIYVYFGGHGAPDPTSGFSYLVPYDGDPKNLDVSAFRVTNLLATLAQTRAREVLAITDACFSGAGGRSVLAPGVRPLVREEAPSPAPRVALFSAASGSEIAGSTADGAAGLFSNYLIEALHDGKGDINGDGQISLRELVDWVVPRVQRQALQDGRRQTPQVHFGRNLGTLDDFILAWGYPQ